MTRILAFVDRSHLRAPVIETARTVARLVGARVDALHVIDQPPSDPAVQPVDHAHPVREVHGPVAATLIGELEADDVVFAVVGARDLMANSRPLGHVTESVVKATDVPIVVVPPSGRALTGDRLRLLLPLDGDPETSEVVVGSVAPRVSAWGEVIPMHVFGGKRTPMFITSDEDRGVLADEFAARYAPGLASTVELRLGYAADVIVDVANELDVDAVVLCWHQHLVSDRAEVVRHLLVDGRRPLILQPV